MKIDLEEFTISAFQNLGLNQRVQVKPGVWAIVGVNKDDGGSNASGKSSLVRSIPVGLQGTDALQVTVKEARNRFLDVAPSIEQRYLLNNKDRLEIKRVIGGKLDASINGEPILGKTDEIQKKIFETLGVTPEQLNHLTNKSQGSFGGFLLMKDKEKKEFLGSFFSLDTLEAGQDKIGNDLSKANDDMQKANGQLQSVREQMKSLQEQIDQAQAEVNKVNTPEFNAEVSQIESNIAGLLETVQEMKSFLASPDRIHSSLMSNETYTAAYSAVVLAENTLANAEKEAQEKSSEIEKELETLSAHIKTLGVVPEELNANLKMINTAIANFHNSLKAKQSYERDLQIHKSRLHDVQSRSFSHNSKTCPTCSQEIKDDAMMQKLIAKSEADANALVAAISKTESELGKLNIRGDEITQLEAIRLDISTQISAHAQPRELSNLQSQIQSLKQNKSLLFSGVASASQNFEMQKRNLKMTEQQILQKISFDITQTEGVISTQRLVLGSKRQQVQQAINALTKLLEQNTGLLQKLSEIETKVDSAAEETIILSKASQVLSRQGFIGYIFDSILEELNSEINKNLKAIPVSYKFSLYFTSDAVAKTTGNVTKSITYKLFSGTEQVTLDTLSGGEQLSVIISVDEALDTVLERRLGVKVNWKVFDEQFFWVDGHSKEMIVEFLRAKAANKCYFIIDHAGEFNASADNTITVVKQNGIATVVA